ncbi:LTA synthase family protein [Porphyromonas pogonae]|uniref:LTA synthase family protein n=1 Tax=Porphyromonas pogonae TaxID=867595 RepID=UPI002E761640|nr:sulfatase-like hydrolase/transferase [Porphyromonas pogonae]
MNTTFWMRVKRLCSTKAGYLLGVFLIFMLFFCLQHVIFISYYHSYWHGASAAELFSVFIYGRKLDYVIAAYLLAIPFVGVLMLYFVPARYVQTFLKYYYCLISAVLALIFTVDLGLYGYWNFRLDTTPLFYLRQPKEALGSATLPMILGAIVAFALFTYALAKALVVWNKRFIPEGRVHGHGWRALKYSPAYLLLGGVIFVMMRGGVSVATANVGMVYHCNNQFINHASINPVFSLMYSLNQQSDIAKNYQYFKDEERAAIYRELVDQARADTDPHLTEHVLSTDRPNIILVIMESFSGNAVGCLHGPDSITPHLDKLAGESLLFSQSVANSFRTDRGVVSILSGYPAQPTTSIMKYPDKCATLPSIAGTLSHYGYDTHMLYGGDINFTNTRGYLAATGYKHITDYASFGAKYKLSKWGVPDEVTFDYLAKEYKQLCQAKAPVFYTFLTLSSHEPFEVPIQRSAHPFLNSVAYTDSCVGQFIQTLKQDTACWDNTLVIFVADHGFPYPENEATPDNPSKYRILHLWAGGALNRKERNEVLCNQTDIAATLLAQMNISHADFGFSRNVLSSQVKPFAFFSSPNLFGFTDSTGVTTWDCDSRTMMYNKGEGADLRIRKGKAYLQTLMEDMQKR